jgi:hypothetical protein
MKDLIFQWNIMIFPQDQMNNQLETLNTSQKSTQPLEKHPSLKKSIDHFAGFDEAE